MARTFRSASLVNYLEIAREAGLDPYCMLQRVGIDARALSDHDLQVPAERVADLLELSAEASGCANFGLRMAESRRLSDLGVIGLVVSHQATLRDVLDTVMRYRNLLNAALAMHVQQTGEIIEVKEELVDVGGAKTQVYELAVGVMSRLFGSVLGPQWRPVSAHFAHPRPKNLALHRKLFGEHIEFESEFNGLVCLASDLDRANVAADPNLARYATQFIDAMCDVGCATSVSYEVRKSIYLLLPIGGATIPRVARGLGLHGRKLQRQLAAEGVEFSDLVNSVRRELAERYLVNPAYSVTRISEMLGYGQPTSFTRWFTCEFGVPPGVWRTRAEPQKGQ
jgi:AraC-like DNA-binding protein